MNSAGITSPAPTFNTISKPNFLTPKSNLNPSSSNLSFKFNTHFPKSKSKSIKACPIRAAMADAAVYVKTESFYDLLGIPENGTTSEIKKAYKKLARKYHPDLSPPGLKEEHTKRFIEVQEAYETLSNPKTRALYDRDMASSGLDLNSIFSPGKRHRSSYYGFDDRSEWEQKWQSQLSELIRRSNCKDYDGMSWGARMRTQRSCCN